jgi:hypothetical protein
MFLWNDDGRAPNKKKPIYSEWVVDGVIVAPALPSGDRQSEEAVANLVEMLEAGVVCT